MAMSIDYETYKKKLIEAEEFKKELNDWIKKRKKLIRLLINLANECDKHQQNCDVAEIVGGTTGAVGGLGLIGASALIIVTGGFAAPVILAGVAATAATLGTATVVGTEITHALIDTNLEDDLDQLIAEDKECMRRLESRYNSLSFGKFLEKSDIGKVIAAILLIGAEWRVFKSAKAFVLGIGTAAIAKVTMLLEIIGSKLTVLMLNQLWCTAFGIAGAGVLVFSIAAIIKTAKSIHNGSKSNLGIKIRYLVKGFKEQLKHAKDLNNALRSYEKDNISFNKEAFKEMLLIISERERRTEDKCRMSEDEYKMITLLKKDWLSWIRSELPSHSDEKFIIDRFVNLYGNTEENGEQKKLREQDVPCDKYSDEEPPLVKVLKTCQRVLALA